MKTNLSPLTQQAAPEGAKPVLEQIAKGMGFVPNLFATFAHNPEALKSYLALSDSFGKAGFTPLEQQVVLMTVSRENQCTYCIAAHSAISAMSKLDEVVIGQLRNGETLNDPKLETLRAFTKRVVASRGWPDESDVKSFINAGFNQSHILGVVLGVAMKTLSNYTNHIAQTPLDDAFKNFKWEK